MDSTATDREPLAEPGEVAAYLGIPEQTLAEWRRSDVRTDHRGPRYMKVGRHVRYCWADIDVWLAERAHGGAD